MESLTIHVSESTHAMLRELAAATDATVSQVIDEALREYRRKKFWSELDASYARLRADPKASADFDRETSAWDTTLGDGLEAETDE